MRKNAYRAGEEYSIKAYVLSNTYKLHLLSLSKKYEEDEANSVECQQQRRQGTDSIE